MPYHQGLTSATKKFFHEREQQPKPEKLFWELSEEEFIKARPILVEGFQALAGKPSPNVTVENTKLLLSSDKPVDIKILTPKDITEPAPTMIYYPGGGFVFNLDMHWIPCSIMAEISACKIIIVQCSLAPEHKFPEGPNEAFRAAIYLYEHARQYGIDKNLFAICGDSSGGNFAALVTNRICKERPDIKLCFQLLVSPNIDLTLETYQSTPFKKSQDQDLMLSAEVVRYFRDLYIPKNIDPKSPTVSPLSDDLTGLPSTIITCGEYDGIRGETEAYYETLKQAGNEVEKIIWPGQVHNSMICRAAFYDGDDPAEIIGRAIKERFHSYGYHFSN